MKIGFFGDSFCATLVGKRHNGNDPVYETYIKKLITHYDATLVNLGVSGSSIYDLILLQIKPFIKQNNYPDVCIFVWTNYRRIFNRKHRGLSLFSLEAKSEQDTDPIIEAAKKYVINLLDWELHEFQYKSALQYFDINTLSKFPKSTKIFHFWAFEKLYDWQHGVELSIEGYPSLMDLAIHQRIIPKFGDWASNHIDGDNKNNLVFETIKQAIDNYEQTTIQPTH